jgi:hypothetical protein
MRNGRSLVWLVLAGVLISAAAGCRYLTTNIGSITANPGDYLSQEVTVVGTVGDSVKLPFLPGAYQLKDDTGEIYVLTSGEAPLKGMRVRIKARVETAATFGGQAIGLHLSELHRY